MLNAASFLSYSNIVIFIYKTFFKSYCGWNIHCILISKAENMYANIYSSPPSLCGNNIVIKIFSKVIDTSQRYVSLDLL